MWWIITDDGNADRHDDGDNDYNEDGVGDNDITILVQIRWDIILQLVPKWQPTRQSYGQGSAWGEDQIFLSASASTINISISANQDQLVLQNTGFPTTHSPLVQTRHWRFLIIMINVVIIIIINTDHHPFIYLKLNLERAWQPHWGPVEHITPPLSTFGHNFIIFPSSSLPTSTPTSTSSSSSTKCSPNHDDDREVRLTDLGVYVCKAANKIDEQEAAVFLHGDYI